MNSPMPIRIVQTNDLVVILYEAWNMFEIIHTDGLPHPGSDNHDPLWMGHPVGKWDGDTLVVDTTGFNTRTNLDTAGHPHSDALHTVERFTRTDAKHIAYEITIEDAKAFRRTRGHSRSGPIGRLWSTPARKITRISPKVTLSEQGTSPRGLTIYVYHCILCQIQ